MKTYAIIHVAIVDAADEAEALEVGADRYNTTKILISQASNELTAIEIDPGQSDISVMLDI